MIYLMNVFYANGRTPKINKVIFFLPLLYFKVVRELFERTVYFSGTTKTDYTSRNATKGSLSDLTSPTRKRSRGILTNRVDRKARFA